jgi:hypothetical protein
MVPVLTIQSFGYRFTLAMAENTVVLMALLRFRSALRTCRVTETHKTFQQKLSTLMAVITQEYRDGDKPKPSMIINT